MNYKIPLIFIFLLISNCTNYTPKTNIKNNIKYSNKGFTLIFDENHYKNKIVSKKLIIDHY